jgi:hypothetical protein
MAKAEFTETSATPQHWTLLGPENQTAHQTPALEAVSVLESF